MNLERNLIDNILECQEKLGQEKLSVSFYYPRESLLELLDCDENCLNTAIFKFVRAEDGRLGNVVIGELKSEKGRFEVTIPADGVEWVYENYKSSEFMREFIREIRKPGNTIESIKGLFYHYSKKVEVKQTGENEWAVYFEDEAIDPYVYHIEQNVFGLEYHRFTRISYGKLMEG